MLQEVLDTCGVENVPAAQPHSGISTELASVTNVTEVIFGGQRGYYVSLQRYTFRFKAWWAHSFSSDASTAMLTCLMHFLTGRDLSDDGLSAAHLLKPGLSENGI